MDADIAAKDCGGNSFIGGQGGPVTGNGLTVANGAHFTSAGQVNIAEFGGTNNYVKVTDPGSVFQVNAGGLLAGGGSSTKS